ncbi:hypothetical protein LCGC14_0424870 [marine sediment metagenome]|uniref:Uncharacterized protein n=1 Tax=marine sediment metagenome TaxID=412755 RepID=A0A0F9SPV4_9ZZZZ
MILHLHQTLHLNDFRLQAYDNVKQVVTLHHFTGTYTKRGGRRGEKMENVRSRCVGEMVKSGSSYNIYILIIYTYVLSTLHLNTSPFTGRQP